MRSVTDILNARLASQLLSNATCQTPEEVVTWMGAIQAQDYKMSKLAIGLRCKAGNDQLIEASIDQGKLIRTHILRPTWHLVAAKDIHWLLELSAPRLKKQLASRHRELKLSDADLNKSMDVLAAHLSNHNYLYRSQYSFNA